MGETKDAIRVLSEGALAGRGDPWVGLARVALERSRARWLSIARTGVRGNGAVPAAVAQLRAARNLLAERETLPVSYRN